MEPDRVDAWKRNLEDIFQIHSFLTLTQNAKAAFTGQSEEGLANSIE